MRPRTRTTKAICLTSVSIQQRSKQNASGATVALLNLGCGANYHADWTNVDLAGPAGVIAHDLRRPLPFPSASFDGVYSSHVLEHLTAVDGKRLVGEMWRVLKPGGVARIVVPDLERICAEYLEQLHALHANPTPRNRQRYEWIKLELIDQMTRETSGGEMLNTLRSGDFDPEYVEFRNGDQFTAWYPDAAKLTGNNGKSEKVVSRSTQTRAPLLRRIKSKGPAGICRGIWKRLNRRNRRRSQSPSTTPPDPRLTGEVHRWMYDRVSLKMLLEEQGFADFKVCTFDESRMLNWDQYQLDRSARGNQPRKPDSLFVEAIKPKALIDE